MLLLNSNDVAIANAHLADTLRISAGTDRFGNSFFAIDDEHGVIEVAATKAEAFARVNSVAVNHAISRSVQKRVEVQRG